VKRLRFIALLPLLLASCSSDKDKTAEAPTSGPVRRSLNERMTESNGYKQDSKGNWIPQTDRRSDFEGKSNTSFSKDYKKQEYKTGDYSKKSFWGNKEYAAKPYAGNTDGSRFQKASRLQGQGAREAGTDANIPDAYQTGTYATGAARETGATPIAKSSNAAIDNRQKNYKQPDIIDWREQRSVTMDQSKGILGR
jgi:hypothetical protein